MRNILRAILVLGATAGPALAGEKCDVPVSEWQPREALESKLEAEGWRVRSIKAADGCYEAVAVDSGGQPVDAYFNPKTFERVEPASVHGQG